MYTYTKQLINDFRGVVIGVIFIPQPWRDISKLFWNLILQLFLKYEDCIKKVASRRILALNLKASDFKAAFSQMSTIPVLMNK